MFKQMVYMTIEKCPECDTNTLITEENETYCSECGYIVKFDAIDRGPEVRNFEQNPDKKRRVGLPVSQRYHDKGLTTEISKSNKDAKGNAVNKQKADKLRKYQIWTKTSNNGERNLRDGFSQIDGVAAKLGISKPIRSQACNLYRESRENGVLRGRTVETVAGACLLAVARQNNIPITEEDILKHSQYDDKKRMSRTIKQVIKRNELKNYLIEATEYIPRIVSRIDAPHIIERLAKTAIQETSTSEHTGKAPTSIAASAIYAAGIFAQNNNQKFKEIDENWEAPTQQKVGEAINVTSVTVRKYYSKYIETLQQHV